jgi:hypothetical protein
MWSGSWGTADPNRRIPATPGFDPITVLAHAGDHAAAAPTGLDAALWDDEPAAARCRSLVKTAPGWSPGRDDVGNIRYETLPFDTTRANDLYEALLGPIADVIAGKQLLIVPSDALTQLPFQVLITVGCVPQPAMPAIALKCLPSPGAEG